MFLEAILSKVINKGDLTAVEMQQIFKKIMSGQLTDAQIAGFLVALKMKGETFLEIAAAAKIMRSFSVRVPFSNKRKIIDTCGTGGDGVHTFNISTVSAFVAAGAGVHIAKHGNRSVSSNCGSADLLETFGVVLNVNSDQVLQCLKEIGIAFLFAPSHHPSMKNVMHVRKQLAQRTIFNILGPLTNPAGAKKQLIGVYSRDLMVKMAKALKELKSEHVIIVHGKDGMDELTTTSDTFVVELKNEKIKEYTLSPKNFGFKKVSKKDLYVGSKLRASAIALAVLKGKNGPHRDIVLLNAGTTIYLDGTAKNISEGIEIARKSIDSGSAMEKLDSLIEFTQSFKK